MITVDYFLSFSRLEIWQDEKVQENLIWYTQVANNEMPAKFLIAKKIPVEVDLVVATEDELWLEHERATKVFLSRWEEVSSRTINIDNIETPDISLMDLNVELVERIIKKCNFCRWNCKVDRNLVDNDITAKTGTCQLGYRSRVSTYFHHMGEEIIFRGTAGSGTIFFTSCTMRCNFCQNGDISKDKENGIDTSSDELSLIIWLLRMEGVHNINFVGGDPTMHLHTIIKAINNLRFFEPTKKELMNIFRVKSDAFIPFELSKKNADYQGKFNAPMLWNSNFFLSDKTIRILRTVIDIWLPDFKFGNKKCARRLARTPWYFETIAKYHKQIYDWGESFSIRHLLMPNHNECCTFPIFDWIKENIPNALVNVMTQYHPDCYVLTNPEKFSDINRRLKQSEIREAFEYAKNLELNYEALTYD